MATSTSLGLIADIGATNARFALVRPDGAIDAVRAYVLNDYAALADAIDNYLAEVQTVGRPKQAVLAVATPDTGDRITLTNHAWTFSTEGLRQHLDLERLRVINDFVAVALAIPHLRPNDLLQLGQGTAVAAAPIGLLGPGSGLGVSALIPAQSGAVPVAGEGGHVTMAPTTARESAVLELMRKRYDHVSAERLLSGPGLVNLYGALCGLDGAPVASYAPAQITSTRIWDEDARTREATEMFCAMLGTVASNLALTLGARGGIYIGGGIVPKLGRYMLQSAFRERFEAKGRLRNYLAAIPTYVITRQLPAFLGTAALLKQP